MCSRWLVVCWLRLPELVQAIQIVSGSSAYPVAIVGNTPTDIRCMLRSGYDTQMKVGCVRRDNI